MVLKAGIVMSDGFGRYDVYAVAGSIYCYPDSNVLRNHFGIKDGSQLRAIEADISAARQIELLEKPVNGRFTANHLCRIHRHLLGDIYPFAGNYRREDIAKGTTRFLSHTQIQPKLSSLLSRLHSEKNLSGLDTDLLIQRSAYYMAELNYIHPFREGNGRAIREFMRQLLLKNGYLIHWDAVSVDDLLRAMVDSVYDTTSLKHILDQCIDSIS